MNRIVIGKTHNQEEDANTLSLTYEEANKMLPILRSDHFKQIVLEETASVQLKNLKFLIQLGRLLKAEGSVLLIGGQNQDLQGLLSRLNLYEGEPEGRGKAFLKSKPEPKPEANSKKLAIGFQPNEGEEEIDQNELLQGENLQINKQKAQNCSTKPRACANCSCGRKETEKNLSKEQLVQSINEGKPVAGCGKCFLGDSFRCGTCPYKGLPAFKPGDRLKLEEEGGVVVETGATVVSATGKVKLQL